MASSRSSKFYIPGQTRVVETGLEKFNRLNRFVTDRSACIVSTPGASLVMIECLPGSQLPELLREAGYDLEPAGEGERILPAGVVENFTRRADGALELLVPGSTRPIAEVRRHAGFAKVERWSFQL